MIGGGYRDDDFHSRRPSHSTFRQVRGRCSARSFRTKSRGASRQGDRWLKLEHSIAGWGPAVGAGHVEVTPRRRARGRLCPGSPHSSLAELGMRIYCRHPRQCRWPLVFGLVEIQTSRPAADRGRRGYRFRIGESRLRRGRPAAADTSRHARADAPSFKLTASVGADAYRSLVPSPPASKSPRIRRPPLVAPRRLLFWISRPARRCGSRPAAGPRAMRPSTNNHCPCGRCQGSTRRVASTRTARSDGRGRTRTNARVKISHRLCP